MAITPPGDPDLPQHFNEIYRRLRALENGSQLAGGVIIDKGGLQVDDPNSGNLTFFLGVQPLIDGSGRNQMVTYLFRNDATFALALADLGTIDGHTFQQALQWFDRQGDTVFADDTVSGQGIARPLISMGAFVDQVVPTATTTSTSFVTLQTLNGYKQHPKIEGQILVYADSGTTGVIQIIDQSSNVIFSTSLASAAFGYVNYGPVALIGTHEQNITLSIQGKVSTGAGKVGCRGVSCVGVGS